jgi:hypothetical protein
MLKQKYILDGANLCVEIDKFLDGTRNWRNVTCMQKYAKPGEPNRCSPVCAGFEILKPDNRNLYLFHQDGIETTTDRQTVKLCNGRHIMLEREEENP